MKGNIDEDTFGLSGVPSNLLELFLCVKIHLQESQYPAAGLLTIAAMFPKAWEKKLVDMTVTPLQDKDLLWADYVLISAMAIQKESARKVIDRCKTLRIKTVAGGPLFTCEPDLFNDVDHLLLGEGELTIPEFLHDLENGVPKHLYNPVGWADLNTTPIPLWALIDIKKYATMNTRLPIQLRFLQYHIALWAYAPD